MQGAAGFFDIGQAADTRTHGHADAFTVGVSDFQTTIAYCLKPCGQTVLNEQVELARFLDRQVFLDIEALYRAAKAGGIGRKVGVIDQTNATAASQNALPTARHIRAKWRQHTHTGDYDASTRHSTLLFSNDDFASGLKKKPHAVMAVRFFHDSKQRLQAIKPGG